MDARANGELAWKMLQQLDEMQESNGAATKTTTRRPKSGTTAR